MDRQRFLRTLHQAMGDESQQDFAQRLGIGASTLSRIRSGQRQPGWRVVRALRHAYPDISLEEWGLEDDTN
jgi:transcriptional regulator with XRE-family HTH domain